MEKQGRRWPASLRGKVWQRRGYVKGARDRGEEGESEKLIFQEASAVGNMRRGNPAPVRNRRISFGKKEEYTGEKGLSSLGGRSQEIIFQKGVRRGRKGKRKARLTYPKKEREIRGYRFITHRNRGGGTQAFLRRGTPWRREKGKNRPRTGKETRLLLRRDDYSACWWKQHQERGFTRKKKRGPSAGRGRNRPLL